MNKILNGLGIDENNLGACIGGDRWIDNLSSDYIESFNPTNKEFLGKVNCAILNILSFLEE